MKNSLTFDVEDWYQSVVDRSAQIRDIVIRQTSKVLDILDEMGVRATFFVLGLVAKAFPELVKKVHQLGHEVASHGYAHEPIFLQTPSAFANDLDRSIKLLEDITGQKVMGYRAPDFSITARSLWALDILEQAGIKYDSSIFPIWNRRYGIPGYRRHFHYVNPQHGGLIEFPLSTVRVFRINLPMCGGGYFRLLPYPVIRSAIMRINSEGIPAMIYMHPYEFDTLELAERLSENESLSLKFLRKTQDINRTKSEMKLHSLLKDFDFSPAAEVLNIDR